jgi:hypothetical protein
MMETGVQRGAPTPTAAQYATPATQRRGIDGALKLEAAAVEKACRGFSETTAPLRRPATATAAAVDSLNGARKCNVANNACPRRPYAPLEKLHEEMTAALTAANAYMEGSRPYAAVRELEAV